MGEPKRSVNAVASALLAAGVGCGTLIPTSMLTNGEIEPFRVRDDWLRGPWDGASDAEGVIRAQQGPTESPDETFLLTFDRGHLKYLSDFAGVNEVVIVFTFEDGPISKDEDRIVKIFGPMLLQPDGALLPEFSKICFGPTALQGRYLRVSIDVYEFDRDEANDTAAIIDLIGSAGEALALANPVTAAEIRVAKEFGKVLAQSNQNDLVLHTSFDLLPYERAAWEVAKGSRNPAPLPLRTGTYGVVKTEYPFALFAFFPATQRLDFENTTDLTFFGNCCACPITMAIDLISLPITALFRSLSDVPDAESMARLRWDLDGRLMENAAYFGGAPIAFDDASRQLRIGKDGEVYRAKSWITFSISKGHDAIPIAVRGHLTESEKKLEAAIKNPSLRELLAGSKIEEAIANLVKAREAAQSSRQSTGFDLVVPKGGFFDDTAADAKAVTELLVEFELPKKIEFLTAEMAGKALPSGTVFQTLVGTPVATLESARGLKFTRQEGFPNGTYELVLRYKDELGSNQLAKFELSCVRRPKVEMSAAANAKWVTGAKIEPLVLHEGDFVQVRSVVVEFVDGGIEPLRVSNIPGVSDGISDRKLELTNEQNKDVEIRSITLKRRGDLVDVVATKAPAK
jgi:hypothetical protein